MHVSAGRLVPVSTREAGRPRGEGLLVGVKYKAVRVKIVGKFLLNYNIIIFYLITGIPRIKKIYFTIAPNPLLRQLVYIAILLIP